MRAKVFVLEIVVTKRIDPFEFARSLNHLIEEIVRTHDIDQVALFAMARDTKKHKDTLEISIPQEKVN